MLLEGFVTSDKVCVCVWWISSTRWWCVTNSSLTHRIWQRSRLRFLLSARSMLGSIISTKKKCASVQPDTNKHAWSLLYRNWNTSVCVNVCLDKILSPPLYHIRRVRVWWSEIRQHISDGLVMAFLRVSIMEPSWIVLEQAGHHVVTRSLSCERNDRLTDRCLRCVFQCHLSLIFRGLISQHTLLYDCDCMCVSLASH